MGTRKTSRAGKPEKEEAEPVVPFTADEAKIATDYEAMMKRFSQAWLKKKDGANAAVIAGPGAAANQERLLDDAREYAATILDNKLNPEQLAGDASDSVIEEFLKRFKDALLLHLWNEYVPRNTHKADFHLNFEAFAKAVWSEGSHSLEKRAYAAIRNRVKNVVEAIPPAAAQDSGDRAGKAMIRRKLRALKEEAGDRVTFESMVADFEKHRIRLTVAAIRKHHSVAADGRGPKSNHLRIYAEIYSGVLKRAISVKWLSSPDEHE